MPRLHSEDGDGLGAERPRQRARVDEHEEDAKAERVVHDGGALAGGGWGEGQRGSTSSVESEMAMVFLVFLAA